MSTIYQFGDFRLHPREGSLSRCGVPVPVTPMVLDLLILLVENRTRLVRREELFEKLWGGQESNANLDRRVSELRKLLAPLESGHIKTVPKLGYRFDGEVTVVEADPAPGNPRRTAVLVGGSLVLAAIAVFLFYLFGPPASSPPRRSIAVVGLENLSERPDTDWVSTALSEMLAAELSADEGLRVVPGELVVLMKDDLGIHHAGSFSMETLASLKAYLRSELVLTGSYVDLGPPSGKVRIDLQVQDAGTGETVFAANRDDSSDRLFDLVASLGAELRAALGSEPLSGETEETIRTTFPTGIAAARHYAEGLKRFRNFDFLGACEALETASEEDPNFSLTYSALSESWKALGYDSRAEKTAAAALQLSADLPREEQLLVEARFHATTHDWEQAAEAFGALWRLYPDNLEYGLALVDIRRTAGHIDRAMELVEDLRQLPSSLSDDPRIDLAEADVALSIGEYGKILSLATRAAERASALGIRSVEAQATYKIAIAHFRTGEQEQALEMNRKASKMFAAVGDRVGVATSMRLASSMLAYTGRLEESVDIAEEALAIARDMGWQSGTANLLGLLSALEKRMGHLHRAKAFAEESIEVNRKIGHRQREGISLIYLAGILSMEGDLRAAEDACQRAAWILTEVGSDKWEAQARSSLAQILIRQGRIPESLSEATAAEAISRRIQDTVGLAIALDAKGGAHYALGDMDAAAGCFEEMKSLGEKVTHRTVSARVDLGMAQVLRGRGDFEGARERIERALQLHTDMGEKPQGALVAVERSRILVGMDDRFAVSAAQEAVERYRELGIRDGIAQAEAFLALALLAEGKVEEPRSGIQRAVDNLEGGQDLLARLEVQIAAARVEAATGDQDLARRELARLVREARSIGCVPLRLQAEQVAVSSFSGK